MNELILAFLTWIAGETGLAMPPPPHIVMLPKERMSELALGRRWEPSDDLRAFYHRDGATVYLRSDWTKADLRSRATLLHELVHHVQEFNGLPSECPANREPQAYDLTFKWLQRQGARDPYAALGIDEFSVMMMSSCRDMG